VCLLAFVHAAAAAAQDVQRIGFLEPPTRDLSIPAFSDAAVGQLLTTLDQFFSAPLPADDPLADPELQLWKFTRWLQTGLLSAGQEARVTAHLDALAAAQPKYATLIERERRIIPTLMIGKTAPEIVGRDLDGVEFKLSDYRGRVVVLTFSGDWCGICRAQYPYQRLLTELYKDWPFAMLSVNSDESVEAARQAKEERRLPYRSWWDGYGESKIEGPISTMYNIYGWPTTYVLDEQGVIRFVDLRQEDLLKAVHQLMDEQARKSASASR
jgi:peroxiredoxin